MTFIVVSALPSLCLQGNVQSCPCTHPLVVHNHPDHLDSHLSPHPGRRMLLNQYVAVDWQFEQTKSRKKQLDAV